MRGTRLARHHGAAYPSFDPAGVLELLVIVLLLVALSACRTAPASPPAPAPVRPEGVAPSGAVRDTTCELAPGPVQPADTLTVALPGPVDPAHAPVPQTDAERLVFPELYETLVRVDCLGRIVPALAQTWTVDSGGSRWTFTLRDDARFWDGAPVTAQDVLAGWRGRDSSLAWGTIASDREVRVAVSNLLPVEQLALPTLAVTKPAPDRGWPIGTGAYWVRGNTATGSVLAVPVRGGARPALAYRDASGLDPRDVLDQGVDLLVTDDPAVVSYANGRPGLVALPLSWDRRYYLVSPSAETPRGIDRQDLARAVHVEARADSGHPCVPDQAMLASSGQPLPARRLVYDRSDRTARELAERLVARGALGGGVPAVGLGPAEFAATLGSNSAWAYVAAVVSRGDCGTWYPGDVVRALVDVRSYAIVRRGIPRLLLDADGTVRWMPR